MISSALLALLLLCMSDFIAYAGFRDNLPCSVAEDENGLPPQIALQVSESGQPTSEFVR